MDEQIKIYESLLNEKASLEKDCIKYSLEYAREFGDQIEIIYTLKVEVITLKKKIAFCVKKSYRNEPIYISELDQYIDSEIMEYQARLYELIEYNKSAKDKGVPITYEEHRKIKKLYYEIVHLIHPDLHPEYKENENISDLWNRAVTAYKTNDYKDLIETYDKIIILVSDKEIVIDDIDNKIKILTEEITEIKNNQPYSYKFLLDNEAEVEAYHEELSKEIKDYEEYKEKLTNDLAQFNIEKRFDA